MWRLKVEKIRVQAKTASEEMSAAYIAGWLEMKCAGMLNFSDNDKLVN